MATIGIFDSGVGGLTVLKTVAKLSIKPDIIYFGDLAHIPYGNKSEAVILSYTVKIVNFLIQQQVQMIIIACNTISAVAASVVETICKQNNILLVNIIDSILSYYQKQQHTLPDSNWLLLATETTIKSNCYQRQLAELSNINKIYSKACQLFVPIIEDVNLLYNSKDNSINKAGRRIISEIVLYYLTEFIDIKIDNILLGCTHYPMINDIIDEIIKTYFKQVVSYNIIDPATTVSITVQTLLKNSQPINKNSQQNIKFYVTDSKEKFTT